MTKILGIVFAFVFATAAFGQGNFQGIGLTPRDGVGPYTEVITFTSATISAPTTPVTANATPLTTLPRGTWLISWFIAPSSAASATMLEAAISTDSTNTSSGVISTQGSMRAVNTNGAPVGGWYFDQAPIVYTATAASTPLYAKAISYGAARNVIIGGMAVRLK